jgi:hypothetical protein
MYIDHTQALRPLRSGEVIEAEPPETYPSGE